MNERAYILVINPGSTSTKLAIFKEDEVIAEANLSHNTSEINRYEKIYDQRDMRMEVIFNWLKKSGVTLDELKAVVGRGGLLRPMPGGTFKVTERMLKDLREGFQGEHASNLGGVIAYAIAEKCKIPSLIVDPVAVDEFEAVARISGIPEIPRRSLVHALNIKAVSREVCEKINKKFEEASLIVAHLGGGISISPVRSGKIIDTNNANDDGPFSPERAGGLPACELISLAFNGKYTYNEFKKILVGKGGCLAYLGTNDARIIDKMIDEGDRKAELIFKSMAYQIGKEIGAMSAVLKGQVDRIVLTGGLSYNKRLVHWIKGMVSFIAPIEVIPGESEMSALAKGALRVLKGEERAKIYEEEVQIYD